MNYIYSKIKQYRSVLNIVAICCFCVILIIFIFSSCNAGKAADVSTDGSTEETTSVTTTESNSEIEETKPEESSPNLISTPITFNDVQYIELYNIEDTEKKIEELAGYIQQLTTAINSDMYEFPARYTMQLENSRLLLIQTSYQANLETLKTWKEEYYYAYKTLDFFIQNGYSKEVACGIIGNMMVETSGTSLSLKPTIYSPGRSHYGLCQWYLKYKPFMANTTFEKQLEYLLSDIPVEFKTFGKCYKKGFTAEDFLAVTSVEDAAEIFAKVYERPGAGTYTKRRQCAAKAYEYFTLPSAICG